MKISVDDKKIGSLAVEEITMVNKKGMQVSFLTLGGIITKMIVPDIHQNFENVVLSHLDYNDYLKNPGYFGAIIGRTSGRIKGAKFELHGKEYQLSKNYGENQGHGGVDGFSKKVFSYTCEEVDDRTSVKLSYRSLHLEEGYPGEVMVHVTYTLNDQNEFRILYEAYPKEDTLINLTNHSYFNLSGTFEESILYHELMINADMFAELDETSAPTGILLPVEGTPFDFRYMREIGEEIREDHPQLILGKGYDHPFLLKDNSSPKLRLAHRFSGRVLEIDSDNECVVVYTQNYTENQRVEGGIVLQERRGIALEFQKLPIGINGVNKDNSRVRGGEGYRQETVYRFKVEEMNF